MVKKNSTRASFTTAFIDEEKISSWNKMFYIKYCETAIQIIKRIRISSTFEQLPRKIGRWTSVLNKTESEVILIRVAMWAKHSNLESKWSREIAQEQVATTAFIDSEKFASWNKMFIIVYCQTAIQKIKRIRISSKFEQLPCKIGRQTSVSNKTESEFILIWVGYVSQT